MLSKLSVNLPNHTLCFSTLSRSLSSRRRAPPSLGFLFIAHTSIVRVPLHRASIIKPHLPSALLRFHLTVLQSIKPHLPSAASSSPSLPSLKLVWVLLLLHRARPLQRDCIPRRAAPSAAIIKVWFVTDIFPAIFHLLCYVFSFNCYGSL